MDDEPERARAAIFEALEAQLKDGEPPETAETFNRLLAEGYPREEVYRLIGCVLADEMFQVMKDGRQYDGERYVRLLKKLPRLPWE